MWFIFHDYINTLYYVKNEYSKYTCKEQPCSLGIIAKIAFKGRSLRKFVQKPKKKQVHSVEKDAVAGNCERLEKDKLDRIMIGGITCNKTKLLWIWLYLFF